MQTRVMMLPALPLPSARPTGQRASPRSHAMRSTLWVFQRSKPLPALTKLRTLVLRHPLGDAGAHLETRHTPTSGKREARGWGLWGLQRSPIASSEARAASQEHRPLSRPPALVLADPCGLEVQEGGNWFTQPRPLFSPT